MKRKPKPAGAWSLVFRGGSLEPDKGVWNPTCPEDWANTVNGTTERYVLVARDDVAKVATLRLNEERMPDGQVFLHMEVPVAAIYPAAAAGFVGYVTEPFELTAKPEPTIDSQFDDQFTEDEVATLEKMRGVELQPPAPGIVKDHPVPNQEPYNIPATLEQDDA